MNSGDTLPDYSPPRTRQKSQEHVHLLFKRNDPHHAVLLEGDVPRYFLQTSSGLDKVKISDAAHRLVVDMNRRILFKDVFIFGERNAGKAVKVADVLTPATKDG